MNKENNNKAVEITGRECLCEMCMKKVFCIDQSLLEEDEFKKIWFSKRVVCLCKECQDTLLKIIESNCVSFKCKFCSADNTLNIKKDNNDEK